MVIHSLLNMSEALRLDDSSPSRPAKAAMTEIFAMSLAGMFIVFAVAVFPGNNDGVHRAMEIAPAMGAAVLQHIGWAFGVYIPILLGFYAIVIGGQLSRDLSSAFRTRRTLGFVAELMTGALVPALVLIIIASIADPSRAGALLLVVPSSAVMFFLAVQLGGFIVFERELRLAAAEGSRSWAKRRLETLRRRSRKPLWLVVVVHTLVGTIIGAGAELVLDRSTRSIGPLLATYGSVAFFLGLVGAFGVFTFRTARDRLSAVISWIIPAGLYVGVVLLALSSLDRFGVAAGVSLAVVVTFSAISTFVAPDRGPRAMVDWTIQGGARGYAANAVALTYVRNTREVRELKQAMTAEKPSASRERYAAFVETLGGKVSPRTP